MGTPARMNKMAKYLAECSLEICADNDCTEDNHNCESYVYMDLEDGIWVIHDICCPDYAPRSYAVALSLPFEGNGADLMEAIELSRGFE